MRKFICFAIFFAILNANEIEISALEFIGDEKKKITYLKGSVDIKRAKDRLKAKEARIYLDKNNKPETMEAIGNVQFWLTLENNREVEGVADKVIYIPKKQEYRLIGNVMVDEPLKQNKVRGDKIIILYKEGYINVVGNEKKPAKLIFKLEKNEK